MLHPITGIPFPTKPTLARPKAFRWVYALVVVLVVGWGIFLYTFSRSYNNVWQAVYHNGGIPDGYDIRGIDVSHYQGTINWERVSRAGIHDAPLSFVIIKATEGEQLMDHQFRRNFHEAQRYGLLRGAYHYFSPSVSATKQAAHYTDSVPLEQGDLPPVLDIEEAGNLSAEEVRDAALTWLLLIEDHYDAVPILYTNLRFKQRYLSGEEFQRYPFWIAHYYVPELTYDGQWKFWQHTDRGRVPGIQTFVDLNVYNGSMYDLQQLCIRPHEETAGG